MKHSEFKKLLKNLDQLTNMQKVKLASSLFMEENTQGQIVFYSDLMRNSQNRIVPFVSPKATSVKRLIASSINIDEDYEEDDEEEDGYGLE